MQRLLIPGRLVSTNHQAHVMTVCHCILSYTREDFNKVNGFNNEESCEMQMLFMLWIKILCSSCQMALGCMPQNPTDDESTLTTIFVSFPREFILHVVQNFGQSLLYGNQYIYQSMPRMLTLWLDYGAEVVDCEKRGRNEVALQGKRAVLGKLNQVRLGNDEQMVLKTHPLLWVILDDIIQCIWVRSRDCGWLVTWFCYQLIAKPGNKTATVLWPDPSIDTMAICIARSSVRMISILIRVCLSECAWRVALFIPCVWGLYGISAAILSCVTEHGSLHGPSASVSVPDGLPSTHLTDLPHPWWCVCSAQGQWQELSVITAHPRGLEVVDMMKNYNLHC